MQVKSCNVWTRSSYRRGKRKRGGCTDILCLRSGWTHLQPSPYLCREELRRWRKKLDVSIIDVLALWEWDYKKTLAIYCTFVISRSVKIFWPRCICSKFGHQMRPLASVTKLVTRRHRLHCHIALNCLHWHHQFVLSWYLQQNKGLDP